MQANKSDGEGRVKSFVVLFVEAMGELNETENSTALEHSNFKKTIAEGAGKEINELTRWGWVENLTDADSVDGL